MGVDFDPGDAHWAYSGFMRFRKRVAWVEGLNLQLMEGYHHDGGGCCPSSKPGVVNTDEEIQKWHTRWADVETTLEPLFDHSDCDGVLTREECEQVLPRLVEILAVFPEGDRDRDQGVELCAGMQMVIDGYEKELRFL